VGSDDRRYTLGPDVACFPFRAHSVRIATLQVSNDEVDLEVPIWIHDLAFIPGSGGTKLVTVTAHRHVCAAAEQIAC
jgi:hypothetical protein